MKHRAFQLKLFGIILGVAILGSTQATYGQQVLEPYSAGFIFGGNEGGGVFPDQTEIVVTNIHVINFGFDVFVEHKSFLYFDLTNVPSVNTITNATLGFDVTIYQDPPGWNNFLQLDWFPDSSLDASDWSAPGSAITQFSVTGVGLYDVDITNALISAIDQGVNNMALRLRTDDIGDYGNVIPPGGYLPQVTIDASPGNISLTIIPEPSTLLLFSIGGSLTFRRRR